MGVKKYRTREGIFWRVDQWLTLPSGERKRFRKNGIRTKEQAQKIEAKVITESVEGEFFTRQQSARLTVRQIWEKYQPVSERHLKSWRQDRNRASHILRHLGARQVMGLSIADLEVYRAARCQEKTSWGATPSDGTLDREVALFKRICSYAHQARLIPYNPLAGGIMLNPDNARQVTLSESDFARLYEEADPELKPILLTAYDTGMRRGEILHLRWDQVDLKGRTIRLRAEDTKTSRPRLIILTERLAEELAALPRHIRCPHVFVSRRTGERRHDIRKQFLDACEKAGIKATGKDGLWFHDLRRSFVTNARRRGVPESVVMKMSGHKTRSVFDRYNIVDEDDVRKAVEKIEAGRARELTGSEGEEEEDKQAAGE